MKKKKLDFNNIRALHQSGQLKAAKDGYLKLLQKNPSLIEALHGLGILYAQEENYDDAIIYLEKALQLQPENLSIILHLANILKFRGLIEKGIDLLKNTIEKNPDFIPAYNNLGTLYYTQENFPLAIKAYQTAIDKKSDYADAYYNLGLAFAKQGDTTGAIATYKKLLAFAPEHFAARFHIACLLMQENQFAEASKVFLEIENAHPEHFETQTNLATCFLKLGNLTEAKAHYLKALELKSDDSQILFNLGVISMQQGDIDFAIQYYQRAARLLPDEFSFHNNLAIAYLAKQHVNLALDHFNEALRIQPENKAIQHTIQFLSKQENLKGSPPEYIKSLFDTYADHYEQHLLAALDYKIPELLLQAVLDVETPQHHSLTVLDLGCGTGLCGKLFKPYAQTLIGVDLSEKMLEIAAQKNIYDELIVEDLNDFLTKKTAVYDLIISGDVLAYLGDLEILFQSVSGALKHKGLFVFNTEITQEKDFKMNQSGRFAHNKDYLDRLAEKFHLETINYQMVVTRMQNNEPVYGHLFVLQRS